HVGPVHRAQRHSHRFRNRRLRHSALAQQHHLDTLALLGMSFPTQRCFQTSDLAFGAFDHLLLRIRWSERITPQLPNAIPSAVRCLATANPSIQSVMEAVSDAFHLVIPSLPGYGFSAKPTTTGWDPARTVRAWVVLMQRLGYT